MTLIYLLPWLLVFAGSGGLFVAEHLFPELNPGNAAIALKRKLKELDDENL